MDIHDRVQADRNWLERLLHSIPGFRGYLGKEERRESDKLQRQFLAGQLQSAKPALDELATKLVDSDQLERLGGLDRLRSRLDRVISRLLHGAYGYTGFFDAVKIGENELDRIYQFDAQLISQVQGTLSSITGLSEQAAGDQLAAALSAADAQIKELDQKLDERDQILKGMK